jgi:uridine kinase
LAGEDVRVPNYDISLNRRIGLKPIITRGKINIVEGLHVVDIFKEDKEGIFFYMNNPLESCLSRRISRDTKAIGVSKKRVEEYFEECIKPMYEKYILPQYRLMCIENYYKYIG